MIIGIDNSIYKLLKKHKDLSIYFHALIHREGYIRKPSTPNGHVIPHNDKQPSGVLRAKVPNTIAVRLYF